MSQNKNYRVIWEIDVEAASPELAAQAAKEIQLDYESTANVFKVALNDKAKNFVPAQMFQEVDLDAFVRTCRKCGCTDDNCEQCIQATGKPCYWTQADLCSRCDPKIKT